MYMFTDKMLSCPNKLHKFAASIHLNNFNTKLASVCMYVHTLLLGFYSIYPLIIISVVE